MKLEMPVEFNSEGTPTVYKNYIVPKDTGVVKLNMFGAEVCFRVDVASHRLVQIGPTVDPVRANAFFRHRLGIPDALFVTPDPYAALARGIPNSVPTVLAALSVR